MEYSNSNPIDVPAYFSGYDFWLTNLNRFNGNFVQAETFKAFIGSSEHGTRFVCQKCHTNDRRLRARAIDMPRCPGWSAILWYPVIGLGRIRDMFRRRSRHDVLVGGGTRDPGCRDLKAIALFLLVASDERFRYFFNKIDHERVCN
jgi:hypothetical protein